MSGSRRLVSVLSLVAAVALAVVPARSSAALVGKAVAPASFAVSQPLRLLAGAAAATPGEVGALAADADGPVREFPANFPRPAFLLRGTGGGGGPWNATDLGAPPQLAPDAPLPQAPVTDAPMPGLDEQFDGLNQGVNRATHGFGVYPPDTIGAASTGFYVQTVNSMMAVWDLNQRTAVGTPKLVFGPAPISTLWRGRTGACATYDDGDPIVLFDELARRWIVTQFALDYPGTGYHECIAVSASANPTGRWYLYDYLTSPTLMNDYPKFGVWPDGYYMSVNQFDSANLNAWAGVGVAVFERARMLAGRANARMIYIDTAQACVVGTDPSCTLWGMLPSDLEGFPPAPGTPNTFVQIEDGAWGDYGYPNDALRLWDFTTNWAAGTATFAPAADLATAAFDAEVCLNHTRNCIPQPGTAVGLDALSNRLMYRAQYRIVGDRASLVLNHTVDVGADRAGIRWYELRNTGGGWSLYQQGTHAPADGLHRWMGSIAMDRDGNIALGYSISGTTLAPNMRYVGRLAGDPLGTLPQSEIQMLATSTAAGSQTGTGYRWGDYSMMDVSPDGCTFWYTNEYLRGTTSAEWYTRVGSFSFPSCTPGELQTKSFPSAGRVDGWVLESGELTGVGGARSAAGDLKVGDDGSRRQARSFLSFATGALPDTAVVVGGLLQVKRHRVLGDPYATLGDLEAEIKRPFFGTSPGLQSADFQDAADDYGGSFLPQLVGGRYSALLTAVGTVYVNTTGNTQFRLAFSSDDDNDAQADALLLYSGSAVAANRPRLTVYYYVPPAP